MTSTPDTPDQDAAEIEQQLAAATPEQRERLLTDTIRTQAGALLDTSLADDGNFLENGLNSLAALELAKNLMVLTGMEIPMVAIVEHPTPARLAHYLGQELTHATS
ncbi:acyl carrier protein [Streptomyces olivoreticuli]